MESIKGVAECTYVVFEKGTFVIAKFITKEPSNTMPKSTFTVKGNMAVKRGNIYQIEADLDSKSKYENSYDATRITGDYDLSSGSRKDLESFLKSVTTEYRAKAILDAIPNVIEVLEAKEVGALVKVKGIGVSTAESIITNYFNQKDYGEAYIELAKYELTKEAIRKICEHFGTAEQAVRMVGENPYELVKVDGFGFTKADTAFLADTNNKPTDERRVVAYIDYMFKALEDEGHTWLEARQFIAKLREFIKDANLEFAVKYVKESSDFVVEPLEDNQYRITSKPLYDLEMNIASEIERLMKSECDMDLKNYKNSIRLTEASNGWEYNEEQRDAILGMVENNVFMLQGLAGAGKSSTTQAFLNAIEANGYLFATSALSGKASDNMAKVTGRDSSTIHYLLGAGQGEKGGFAFNDKNQLSANVVVLDELSMVNARIFLSLLKAIKSGSKLIMIGDFGQLEAIGIGVMGGLIRSKVLPMALLKKVNRQSQDSAIITHSISVRNGLTPDGLRLTAESEDTYGKREDLKYIIVDNKAEHQIFDKAILEFKKAITKYDINDVQIICSTKTNGVVSTYALNKKAQQIYNPQKVGDTEVELGFKEFKYALRMGDKVINMKNNRSTLSPDREPRPIYNGNTGIITNITNEYDELIVTIKFDGIGEVNISGEALNNIELGYAITVHKSQGSTIKCVIFALPFHYLLNTREFVYTGMTRASDYQVVITSPRSFRQAIKNTSVRKKQIMLDGFIKDKLEKKEVLTNG